MNIHQLKSGQKSLFPLPIIEQSDIDSIQIYCDGFCHSGKINRLENILKNESLTCSKRHTTQERQRDNSSVKPDNAGIYFRFVPYSACTAHDCAEQQDKNVIDALTGPGSDGGTVYFMKLNHAINREITTTSSTDAKYGFNDAQSAASVFSNAAKHAFNQKINNAEVAFFWEVELSAIASIYCMTNRLTATICNCLSAHNFSHVRTFSRNLGGARNNMCKDEKKMQMWTKFENKGLSPSNTARASLPSLPKNTFCLVPYQTGSST